MWGADEGEWLKGFLRLSALEMGVFHRDLFRKVHFLEILEILGSTQSVAKP